MAKGRNIETEVIINEALAGVLRLCQQHKIFIAGFVWSKEDGPAMMTNFGNCNDAGDLALYEKLVDSKDSLRRKGQSIQTLVGKNTAA